MKYLTLLMLTGVLFLSSLETSASANSSEPDFELYIPRSDAAIALNKLAVQTDSIMLFSFETVQARQAEPIIGRYTLKQALALILTNSGLSARITADGVVNITNATHHSSQESKTSALLVSHPVPSAKTPIENDEIEVILVEGYFKSIKQSLELKRFSDTIVDGISSEELGKFPDQNVAESLQRITGVSIDRDGGEGKSVTVRGFGPEFNAVLYNGRVLATEGQGRDFSFDILSSDIISGANAYKTSTAEMLAGGIGATINLTTAKPMDSDGLRATFTAKSTYDTLAEKYNPQLSAVLSWSDNTLGFLLSANHLTRDYRRDSINTEGWMTNENINWDNSMLTTGEGDTAIPVYFPRTFAAETDRGTRTRTGGAMVLQYRPSDKVEITADALLLKFAVASEITSFGAWTNDWAAEWNRQGWQSANINANQTLTAFEYSPLWDTGLEPRYQVMSNDAIYIERNRPTETKQFGLNAVWTLTDELTLTYDGSLSNASNTAGGRNRFIVAKDLYANPMVDFSTSEVPSFAFSDHQEEDGNGGFVTIIEPWNISELFGHQMYLQGDSTSDEVVQHRFDVNRELESDLLSSIKAGIYLSNRQQDKQVYNTRGSEGGYWAVGAGAFGGNTVSLPSELFGTLALTDFFDGSYPDMFTIDSNSLITYLNSPEAIDQLNNSDDVYAAQSEFANSPYGIFTPVQNFGDSWRVKEAVLEVYIQALFEIDIADMLLTGNIGVRYAQTDVKSQGWGRLITDLQVDQSDKTNLLASLTDPQKINGRYNYDNFLPSLNIRLEINDEQILRFAASQSMTRPTLNALRPALGSYNTRVSSRTAAAGNPQLNPYLSSNLDLSYEWYFDRASYLSIAGFYKNMDDFITQGNLPEEILFDNSYGEFLVSRPRNNSESSLKGLELALQHTFDSGFGGQVNYTRVNPENEFDPLSDSSDTFVLEGLSDSANIVVFYQDKKLQTRIAYNWRDEFLYKVAGQQGQPEYIESYGQIDISVIYTFTEYLSVIFEGINITEETRRSYSIYKERMLTLEDTGARFSLGIRGEF